MVDRERYLPRSWTDYRERCRAAKVPDERGFATKGELAKRLALRALSSALPLAWVAADAAYGQEGRFRRLLEQSGLGYDWWTAARAAHGDKDGTKALIEVLLLGRHMSHEHIVAGLATVTFLTDWRMSHLPPDTRPLPSWPPMTSCYDTAARAVTPPAREKPRECPTPSWNERTSRRHRH